MLLQLSINNYAIIDQLNFVPNRELNIVTGETGAGKSIILGALSLILGERADTSVLINKETKSIVEATFDVANNQAIKRALLAAELDVEDHCIIRREINSSGKSRAFVNDTPVTLSVLNRLTALLVDLHQQFDNHAIEDDAFQLSVVDILAQNVQIRDEYREVFKLYQLAAQELQAKQDLQAQWQKDADYKQFLFDELAQINFQPNEIEEAEQQLKQLNSAEKIISILQQARYVLEEGETPLSSEIRRQALQLHSIADVLVEAESLYERLNAIYAETKDIADELARAEDKISLNPEQMARLEERLDAGIKLQKKHGVQSTNELIALFENLGQELKGSLNLHDEIELLKKRKAELFDSLQRIASQLTASRQAIIPQIVAQITALLSEVGMPNAQFSIQLSPLSKPANHGCDEVSFLLDANKSGHFQSIDKAASGGEMSRIALCIKSLIARAIHLPTLIFDEVDTGISGEAARKVGALLKDLAQFHQVICITHQPQVAAKASAHFFVYKELGKNGKMNTKIRELEGEEKIVAIARMIGGAQPSEAAINNARELILL